jgi:hypothetical protein
MGLRLFIMFVVLVPVRAAAEPTSGPCSCEIRDPGRSQRRNAKILAAIGVGLGGSAFAVSAYERLQWNDAIERYEDPRTEDPERAREDANHAVAVARYVGTGLFAAGTISVGIATYLYLTAPDRELVLKTAVVPNAGRDYAGVLLVRAF